MASDALLGKHIHNLLLQQGLETPIGYEGSQHPSIVYDKVSASHTQIMRALNLDLNDDSLKGTPDRIAKMYAYEIFDGLDYNKFPACTTVTNKFAYDEMVAVKGITVQSMCEHHFLPFIGEATIAYIPKHKVLGLSKFNRIVEFFSHRPQIQERLTEQIAATLRSILECDDVAVVIHADHYCVKLRGVRDACSSTVTSKLLGKFRSVPELRAEFLSLTR